MPCEFCQHTLNNPVSPIPGPSAHICLSFICWNFYYLGIFSLQWAETKTWSSSGYCSCQAILTTIPESHISNICQLTFIAFLFCLLWLPVLLSRDRAFRPESSFLIFKQVLNPRGCIRLFFSLLTYCLCLLKQCLADIPAKTSSSSRAQHHKKHSSIPSVRPQAILAAWFLPPDTVKLLSLWKKGN